MGKMRFKLSHVMPHAWFFKLKEVGKPGRNLTYKASEPATSPCASAINHKSIDIPFPVTNTLKQSPPVEPAFAEDCSSSDQLPLMEFSADDDCRLSIVLPHTSAARLDQHIIPASADSDHPFALSTAPAYAKNNHGVSCRVNFDVRELDRRLKALGSEERRKYYTSPMLLSVAVPTPLIDEGMHLGIGRDDGAEKPSLDMAATVFPLYASGSNNRGRPPLMDPDPYADGETPFVSCISKGDGLCRSVDESIRHSTSSSDTGFERGSSSVWERDVFSITSDGSEAFTMTYTDDVESMHRSRQRYRRLRDRMSPSLYGAGHMDSGLSRFYVDHRHDQEAGPLAENDRMSDFYKDGLVVDDAEDEVEHLCEREMDMSVLNVTDDESGQGLGNGTYCGDSSRNNVCAYSSCGRTGLTQSPSNSRVRSVLWRATELAADYEEMSDSISMQCDRDDMPSAPYDSGADRLSACTRKPSGYGDFPYVRCKERLLSRRPDSDRPKDSIAIIEAEQESPPTKFKVKQRTCARQSTHHLDPGLYNSVSLGQRWHGCDTVDSTDMDSMASWSTLPSTSDRRTHLHRRRTAAYHIKSPQPRAKELPAQQELRRKASLQDQGPSRPEGTPRAARDPSFEQFSPATSGGGGASLIRGDCSRVLDSFAMVKCSYEPKHDFKESMLEMILEKDLRTSHDMVELLQCYLTLNADAYHDTIVKVFTEVWSEMFRHV